MSLPLFSRVEKQTGTKIPNLLKKILSATGFESEWAISNLDIEGIEKIEKFISENKYVVKDTKYEHREPFQFDIGDKVSILALAKHVNTLKIDKLKEKEEKKLKNIETSFENFDPTALKNELISRIKNYMTNKNIQFNLSASDVVNCDKVHRKIRCVVLCPNCKVRFPCLKSTHWKISNFTKHLKKHTNPSTSSTSTTSVHRTDNGDELDQILRRVFNTIHLNPITKIY